MIFGWVRNICLAASVVMMLVVAVTAQAQWVKCGPQGGIVTSLVCIGTTLFASTDTNYYYAATGQAGEGVFRSTDSGARWTQVNTGIPDTNIPALGTLGTDLFAAIGNGRIFLSGNNGDQWSEVTPLPNAQPILQFVGLGNDLFVATRSQLYLTTNKGTSWLAAGNGLSFSALYDLTTIGTVLFAGTDQGIFLSTDFGMDWTLVDSIGAAVTSAGNDLFIAAGGQRGIYCSTDSGSTWQNCSINGGCSVVNGVMGVGNTVFSTWSQTSVLCSNDFGKTWNATSIGSNNMLVAIGPIDALAQLGTMIFAGTDSGVLRSMDGGVNWAHVSNGMYMFEPGMTSLPYNFVAVGHTLIASNYQNGIRSNDGGTRWTIDTFATNSNTKYVAIGNVLLTSLNQWGIYRSDDFGISWRPVNTDSTFEQMFAMGSLLFGYSSYEGLARSTDTGKTWTNVSNGLDLWQYDGLSMASDGQNLYAVSGSVYHSSDLGQSWTNLSGSLIEGATAVTANGANICVASGNRMFRSTDGGASWSANDFNFSVNSFLQSGSNILAATDKGIYLSNDNGAIWGLAATGMLPDTNPAYAFGMIDSTVYVSTANGIWKQQRSEIPFSVANSSVAEVADPSAIELSPNPTSGTLMIQGEVSNITVTNLLGETMLDVPSSRSSETTLDLTKLQPGTYFARIGTADGVVVRKIVKE